MKKLLLVLIIFVLLGGAYLFGLLRGATHISTPPARWSENSELAQAWREVSVAMEAAGAKVYAATDDPREREDGITYLSQLLAASLEMKLAKGDRAHPAFTNWMGDDRKILGDSPDAVYHSAEISPDHAYEILGNRGDAEYFGVILYGRSLNGWNRAAANINHREFDFDSNGNFRVVISKEEPDDGSNWLPLEKDTHMVMVRQYFHNRSEKKEAEFSIRNMNQTNPSVSDDEVLAARMREAITFFNESLDGTLALAEMLIATPNSSAPPKSYNQDFGGIFYPTENNQYLGTWFSLEDDEALIIEGEAPDVDYWSVSLQNRWLQSLDYENFQVSLDNHKIETENNRYRIVVSSQKLATGNWLDTAGYKSGLIAIRYQLAGKIPPPKMTVVAFDEIDN